MSREEMKLILNNVVLALQLCLGFWQFMKLTPVGALIQGVIGWLLRPLQHSSTYSRLQHCHGRVFKRVNCFALQADIPFERRDMATREVDAIKLNYLGSEFVLEKRGNMLLIDKKMCYYITHAIWEELQTLEEVLRPPLAQAAVTRAAADRAEADHRVAADAAKDAEAELERAKAEVESAEAEFKQADDEAAGAEADAQRMEFEAQHIEDECQVQDAEAEAKRINAEAERAATDAERARQDAQLAEAETKRLEADAERAEAYVERVEAHRASRRDKIEAAAGSEVILRPHAEVAARSVRAAAVAAYAAALASASRAATAASAARNAITAAATAAVRAETAARFAESARSNATAARASATAARATATSAFNAVRTARDVIPIVTHKAGTTATTANAASIAARMAASVATADANATYTALFVEGKKEFWKDVITGGVMTLKEVWDAIILHNQHVSIRLNNDWLLPVNLSVSEEKLLKILNLAALFLQSKNRKVYWFIPTSLSLISALLEFSTTLRVWLYTNIKELFCHIMHFLCDPLPRSWRQHLYSLGKWVESLTPCNDIQLKVVRGDMCAIITEGAKIDKEEACEVPLLDIEVTPLFGVIEKQFHCNSINTDIRCTYVIEHKLCEISAPSVSVFFVKCKSIDEFRQIITLVSCIAENGCGSLICYGPHNKVRVRGFEESVTSYVNSGLPPFYKLQLTNVVVA